MEPVYLWDVSDYDPVRIAALVGRCMDELGLRPEGRVLVKPNTVIAHHEVFPHAFTRAEVLDGVMTALVERGGIAVTEYAVGERCGITIPTRMALREAGYLPVIRRHGFKTYYFDEVSQVEVPLVHPGRLRDSLYLPEPVAAADFLVNCPKFKTHPWTTVTFALKNYIGIQDDGARLIDHDHRLDEKIRDLNFTVWPRLIVIDGIVAGLGRMLTPRPVPLGLLIIGKNSVATDTVCSIIAGRTPSDVDHLRLSAEAGLGPLSLDEIELRGDIDLAVAEERAEERGLRAERERVEPFFAGTRISAIAGPPPEPERTDYCWGGCPGAAEEALDIIRQFQGDAGDVAKPLMVLYGDLRGRDVQLEAGQKVLVFGDCARFDGRLGDRPARWESTYVERRARCIHTARSSGVITKTIETLWRVVTWGREPYLRTGGCPSSVAEHVLLFSMVGKVANPYLDPRTVIPFGRGWIANRLVCGWRWLTGRLRRLRLPQEPGRYPAADGAEERAGIAGDRAGAPPGAGAAG